MAGIAAGGTLGGALDAAAQPPPSRRPIGTAGRAPTAGAARGSTPRAPTGATPRATTAPLCSGDYADDLTALSSRVRELERDPARQYSYCLRTVATYECLSYAPDGTVRRSRKQVVAHGTGFAYRRTGGETYLLTNDHVASWPAVTDEEHPVEDVPAGCKRVSESIKIVDDEDDGYDANDVALSLVVTDPALDAAVLKTRAPLQVIPYRIGKSAALRVGNVVAVHGFPLGAFAATNLGKVVNAFDRDTVRDWDHVDFVTDALLSPGNSGSPVLALSCRTGEYELVGVFHAGYTRGSALNVVVGIDQVRDMMATLKRAPRLAGVGGGGAEEPGAAERAELRAAFGAPLASPFFPLGGLVATLRLGGDGPAALAPDAPLRFEVYSKAFPLHDERLLVIEDRPSPAGGRFGEIGRILVGNRRGLREWARAALDAETQAQLERVVTRLRAAAVTTARLRAVDPFSAKGVRSRRDLERVRARQAAADADAAQLLADLADRLGPKAGDPVVTLADALGLPSPSRPVVDAARAHAAGATPHAN